MLTCTNWVSPNQTMNHIVDTCPLTKFEGGLLSRTTRVGRYQKIHPLTPILIIGHSSSSIYNDPWHPLCSFYVLDNPLGQPLSRSSLVFLLVLDPELHTPYISSWQPTVGFMTHVTCRLTAKNRDQLRNPTLGNRVRATFTFY